jgi:energy-coupling factor transporter ATP-binding protein EcfA2
MTLLSKAFSSDPLFGANQIAMIGRQGTGKTTLLRAYAEFGMKQKHTVVWRGRPSKDQWHLIPGKPNIIVPDGFEYRFYESPQVGMQIKERTYDLTVYEETREIPRILAEGGLNVLIEPNLPKPWISLWWLYLLRLLGERKNHEWIRICFDEVLDVWPSSAVLKDDSYSRIMPEFARSFYDFRRQNIELLVVGHTSGDLHFDIRRAFTGILYLQGAEEIRGWRVTNRALRNLKSGHCIVELPNVFGDEMLQIPESRQPSSKISFSSDDRRWIPDPTFREFSKNILEYNIFKKYRYWREGKIVQVKEKRGPVRKKKGGISRVDSFKDSHVKGKKTPETTEGGG